MNDCDMRVCDYCIVCIHTTSTPGISYAYILYTRLSAFRVDRPRRKKKAIKMHSTGASLIIPAKCGGLDYFAYRMTHTVLIRICYFVQYTRLMRRFARLRNNRINKKTQVPVSRLRISRTIACFFPSLFQGRWVADKDWW